MSEVKNTSSRGGLWRAPVFSPRGFLVRALLVVLAFLIVHALGLRECASVVCGSHATLAGSADAAVAAAVLYILLYLAFVFAAPILLIAAGVFWGLARIRPLRSTVGH